MNGEKVYKRRAIAKIIVWSVVLVILVGVFSSVMILGNVSFEALGGGFSVISGYTYADADRYNVGNRSYTDEISGMDIEWTSGDIRIQVYGGEEIKLEESGAGESDTNFMRTRISGGVLYVKYVKSGIRWFSGIPEKSLTVYLPEKYAPEMNNIDIEAVSADVGIEGEIVCRELDLDGVSGRLNISSLTAERVDIDTVSGNINISGRIGEFDVSGVSAKVVLELDSVPRSVNMNTVSGDVDIALPEGVGFIAELDSVSGGIRVESNNVGKTYRYGDGSSKFDFESVSGDISIRFK